MVEEKKTTQLDLLELSFDPDGKKLLLKKYTVLYYLFYSLRKRKAVVRQNE